MAVENDENNPLQAEILREVAEEMKEEQFKQLWRKIGPYVTGLIVTVLVVTGCLEFYKYRQEQIALADSEKLQAALTLIDSADAENGADMLKELSENGSFGYRSLAAFHYADYLIAQGKEKYADATAVLDGVINDAKAPTAMKNMALFDKISLRIENGDKDYAGMEKELETLAAQSEAWSPLALEMAAGLALRQNNPEKAKARWNQILSLPDVSDAKRLQIGEYISYIDENMPAKAKSEK